MDSAEQITDVIICGSGVIGMVLAALLAKQGLTVVLIEAKPTTTARNDHIDPRTLAITPASQKILQQAAIWQALPSERIGRFEQIHVWDEAGDGRIEFDVTDSIESVLGYIIENSVLHDAAKQVIDSLANVTSYQPATVTAVETGTDQVLVVLDNGRRLHGRLLVAADGQRSRVRDLAGIAYVSDSYDQTAVAGVIKTTEAHGNTARQRFLSSGILALLPLWDGHHCGLVWSTDKQHAHDLLNMTDSQFCHQLTLASENVLGAVTECLSRQGFPLSSAQAEYYCQHRLALLGDAAHTVHPLAGQGANLGMMDAAVLAEVIVEAQQQQRDFGQHYCLRRYERRRRGDNILMMNVFSGFKHLFESDLFPVPVLRNTGMSLLDKAVPLKRWIMHRAMGLSGDVPANIKTTSYL